jgi:putative PIN family toxin of toxin-antitoxin system
VRKVDCSKAVLDTNVWLDWLLFDDPRVTTVRDAHRGDRLRILACAEARAELADVLSRPRLIAQALASRSRRGGTPPDVGSLLDAFDAAVTLAPRAPVCGLTCRDPDDQRFVDLAVAQSAHFLLTRDRALLALARAARRRFGLVITQPEHAEMQSEP